MAEIVHNEKELGKALKDGVIEIEIADPKLNGHIAKIRATGNVAWGIAIGAIGVAVVAVLAAPATGGTSTAMEFVAAPAAIGILGADVAASSVAISVAAGGVGALNKLRNYKTEKRNGKTYLVKK